MGCATTTVKIASIIFNVLFAILAIAVIVGVATNPDELIGSSPYATYVACALVLVFAVLGIYAALRESILITSLCAVFLLLLAIAQIVFSCVGLDRGEEPSGLAIVDKAWENNEMDDLQAKYECCGKVSAQDYVLLNVAVPASCYPDGDASKATAFFADGCSGKLHDYHEAEYQQLLIGSWVLAGFEIVGFLLAVFLVINFRNKQRRLQF